MDKSSREYEVCLCYHTLRGDVEDLIKEKGIDNLKDLCEIAEIGNKCGERREDLEMILNEVLAQENEH